MVRSLSDDDSVGGGVPGSADGTPGPPRRQPADPAPKAFIRIFNIGRPLLKAMCRFEWYGTENLPAEGGFIAAANHSSNLDPLTFSLFLVDNGYTPRILAKRSLFTTPVIGSIMRATHMIPVDRGTEKAGESLAAAAAELEKGACVALYPEGTLTRDPDYWPMEGKTGVARMAFASRVPVIPIGQWGVTDVLDRYSKVLKPFGKKKRVQLRVGAPVDLSDLYTEEPSAEVLREATSRVMDAISDLVGESRGETPPKPRFDLRQHPANKKKQTHYPPTERP